MPPSCGITCSLGGSIMPESYSPPPGASSRKLEARGSAGEEDARPDDGPTTGGKRRLYHRARATLQVTRGPLLAADLIMASIAAFIMAASFFLLSPGIDIAVADFFYIPGHGFVGHVPWVAALRLTLKVIFVVGVTLAVIGLLRTVITARPFAGLTANRWLFFTLALSVGPGLVANVLLKDQMGRARPHQVEIFGGSKQFTAPLIVAKQCQRNCSFVSGEAASMFALFFALAFLVTRHSTVMICTALVMGSFAGLIRMAQGAHFFSDVAFAGIFMCITVAGLHLLIIDAQPLWRRGASALADRRGRHDRNH
jgi:lipid A 4'-phosphatase